jgi:bifunctional UDP-N-acetylglucosamine pyrophosphorylase / glucosamine-1-phosphate N-acetyltransferase
MDVCAVIPAAGRGSRLGLNGPKILAPLAPSRTIWCVLREKLLGLADHIHLVLSPGGRLIFEDQFAEDLQKGSISVSIQETPLGMGDAVFRGWDVWRNARTLLVIWGDQVFVSKKTLRDALDIHEGESRTVVIPVVSLLKPYVDYQFDAAGQLSAVRQSREGDACRLGGLNDVGTFVLSVDGLHEEWSAYSAYCSRGAQTGELNFLPFFPFLAKQGWSVKALRIDDPRESRGINTPEDLSFFQSLFERGEC